MVFFVLHFCKHVNFDYYCKQQTSLQMLIHDRIKLIIKANNESPSSFADNIDVKRSNLSHVLSGRNKPSLDFLSKIISCYPNVNASWLITGVTRDGQFEAPTEKKTEVQQTDSIQKEIEQIIVTYKDGTFNTYNPSVK